MTLPCKIWPELLGGFLDSRGRKVGDWCVMVAATRGGSLSIAVQPWLKGNSTHKQKKKKKKKEEGRIALGRRKRRRSKRAKEKKDHLRREATN